MTVKKWKWTNRHRFQINMVLNCELAFLGCDAPMEVSSAVTAIPVICILYIFQNKRTDFFTQNPRKWPILTAMKVNMRPNKKEIIHHSSLECHWKNDIRDVGSTADLVLVFLKHLVHWYLVHWYLVHWYPLVPDCTWLYLIFSFSLIFYWQKR